ncbi:MAG TPA: hypothetical protein VF487_08075 [Chitinophagaceae bacterium]
MKNLLLIPLSFFALLITTYSFGQAVSINTDGSSPDASSILDIKNSNKGILIPRMTKTQRAAIVSPATGLLVYQNAPDSVGFYYYNGSVWLLIADISKIPASGGGGGGNKPTGPAGGDLTGTYPDPSIANGAITTAKLADGSVTNLKLAANAVNTTNIVNASVTAAKLAAGVIPTSLPPNGTAGGDLTGSYPNPTVAAGAITNTKLAANAVNTTNIVDASVTAAKLAAGVIPVIPTSLPPNGTAGGDLTGSYPNPTVATGAITNTKLANNAVNTTNIVDASVTAAKLATNAVNTTNIVDASVTAAKLAAGVIPVIPTSLPPNGTAGGDLTGSYPNPTVAAGAITNTKLANNAVNTANIVDASVTAAKLATNAVNTTNIVDASVTAAKLAPGVIPTSIPISGTAGGDLTGTYPNPTVADGVITNTKLAANAVNTPNIVDASVTAAKLAPGVIPTSIPVSGTAGGDLTGTYPNPTVANGVITNTKLAANAVNTTNIVDASVTAAKLAAGVIPTALPPNGTAGGDLTGSYPNPTVAAGAITNTKLAANAVNTTNIVDASVTTAKLAAGVIPTALPPNGTAGGDLTGSYPNPTVATGAITNTKLATNAVNTTNIVDASVTTAKLAAGVIPTSLPPNGTAGGDLTGSYPNPTVATGAITNTKLATNAVSTTNIVDASVTAAKLAAGLIPTSLPPNGTAGGDLSGSYPNPAVNKIQGVAVNNTAPTNGQVLKYNGSQWIPSTDNTGITLPYSATVSNAASLFALTNSGTGAALEGVNSTNNIGALGIIGKITSTTPNTSTAGIRGINNGTNYNGYGVWGSHAGGGIGVFGSSVAGNGVQGSSTDGPGVLGTSINQSAGYFDIANASNGADAIYAYTAGLGSAVNATGENGNGVWGSTFSPFSAGVLGYNFGGGEAITGVNNSLTASAVVGRNNGGYAGVQGITGADDGIGVLATANMDGAINGNALVAAIEGTSAGNPAVFKANNVNVARIDRTGKGFFNGGTQMSGADVAEYFDIEGIRSSYETGDVLVISQYSDRKVERSSTPYSTLVAGVYATQPGIMLTDKNAEQDQLEQMVPMGVIGVIPTKVCLEGGAIKRGDLIVTSSLPGVAMKADPDKVKIGQVIGKALQDYNSNEIGKINILVSIK